LSLGRNSTGKQKKTQKIDESLHIFFMRIELEYHVSVGAYNGVFTKKIT